MSAELDTEILSQIPVLIFGGLKSNISVNGFFSPDTQNLNRFPKDLL